MDDFKGTMPYEVFRAEQARKAAEEAVANPIDRIAPGGKYQQPDGTFVDADGKPLKAGDVNALPAGTHASLVPAASAFDPGDEVRAEMQQDANKEAQRTKTQAKSDPRSEDRKG